MYKREVDDFHLVAVVGVQVGVGVKGKRWGVSIETSSLNRRLDDETFPTPGNQVPG